MEKPLQDAVMSSSPLVTFNRFADGVAVVKKKETVNTCPKANFKFSLKLTVKVNCFLPRLSVLEM